MPREYDDSLPPWRQPPKRNKFEHAAVKATNQPGQTPTMYIPSDQVDGPSERRRSGKAMGHRLHVDSPLKISFQRNFRFLKRSFSLDTLLMPFPPSLSYSLARNLGFFSRIFTQFFDPKGIQNAQKSIGLGQEQKIRRVR